MSYVELPVEGSDRPLLVDVDRAGLVEPQGPLKLVCGVVVNRRGTPVRYDLLYSLNPWMVAEPRNGDELDFRSENLVQVDHRIPAQLNITPDTLWLTGLVARRQKLSPSDVLHGWLEHYLQIMEAADSLPDITRNFARDWRAEYLHLYGVGK